MDIVLTDKQRFALNSISETVKTGAHWKFIGISPRTISDLMELGLIASIPGTGNKIIEKSWYLTDEGKEVLERYDSI